MKIVAIALLFAFTNQAHAESFDDRVKIGKSAEVADEFKSYQATMYSQVGDHFAATMRHCFDATKTPETEPFALVADISQNGKPLSVVVSPKTNIAECFAIGFSKANFPKPPKYPNRAGFPITVEMQITP